MNIQNLVLDINKKPFQTITANTGEVASRFVRISIVDKSIPVDLTGVTVSLYAKKPDGNKVFNNVTIEDKTNGIILAELTSQILAVEGLVKLTLLLVKNGGKLCSKQFLLNVDSSIVDDEAIESTNEFTALVDALGRVNNIDSRFENVSSQLEQIKNKITISVKDFGAIGDGITDDTQAIKRMCEYVNQRKCGKIIFPKGIYKVSIQEKSDYWFNNFGYVAEFVECDIEIDLCGSSIKLESNNSPWYSIFAFKKCNFKIANGILVGDRILHNYSPYREKDTHEWGYGIANMGSIGVVSHMDISQFTGDGINSENIVNWGLNETSSRAYIEVLNCKIHHCRRQGITVGESDGGCIKNTQIYKIGDWDGIEGADPKSGIDLEFELIESSCESVVLDNVNIYDCSVFAIVGTVTGDILNNLTILNSNIEGRIAITNAQKFEINNTILNVKYLENLSIIKKCTLNKCNIYFDDKSHFLGDCILNDCTIKGIYNECEGIGTSILGVSNTKIEFNNCNIKDILGDSKGYSWSNSLKDKALVGFNKWIYDATFIFNNCVVENCSCIINDNNVNSVIFNKSIIKNSFIGGGTTDKELICFNYCDIENTSGYYTPNPIVYKNCNIIDNGVLKPNFTGSQTAIMYNCNASVIRDTNESNHQRIKAYNSYLNYTCPSGTNFSETNLYNCYFTCNLTESSFNGTKVNTTYIVK